MQLIEVGQPFDCLPKKSRLGSSNFASCFEKLGSEIQQLQGKSGIWMFLLIPPLLRDTKQCGRTIRTIFMITTVIFGVFRILKNYNAGKFKLVQIRRIGDYDIIFERN